MLDTGRVAWRYSFVGFIGKATTCEDIRISFFLSAGLEAEARSFIEWPVVTDDNGSTLFDYGLDVEKPNERAYSYASKMSREILCHGCTKGFFYFHHFSVVFRYVFLSQISSSNTRLVIRTVLYKYVLCLVERPQNMYPKFNIMVDVLEEGSEIDCLRYEPTAPVGWKYEIRPFVIAEELNSSVAVSAAVARVNVVY